MKHTAHTVNSIPNNEAYCSYYKHPQNHNYTQSIYSFNLKAIKPITQWWHRGIKIMLCNPIKEIVYPIRNRTSLTKTNRVNNPLRLTE
jgi:hypothetical protein